MSSRREPEPDPPQGFSIMEDNPLRAPTRALQPLPPPGNQQPHRATNFYIENILRPDFGLKKKKDGEEDDEEEEDGPDQFGPVRVGLMKGRGQLTGGKAPRTGEEDPNLDSRPKSPEADVAPAAAAPPWPAWVYCTRYSDRPSSGPRSRKPRRTQTQTQTQAPNRDDKRPRTAFTSEQLQRLKTEFQRNRYLTEHRRRNLARDLDLSEPQVKIWFQNNRAKTKKASGNRNSLALQLMAEGLYNHSTARDGD